MLFFLRICWYCGVLVVCRLRPLRGLRLPQGLGDEILRSYAAHELPLLRNSYLVIRNSGCYAANSRPASQKAPAFTTALWSTYRVRSSVASLCPRPLHRSGFRPRQRRGFRPALWAGFRPGNARISFPVGRCISSSQSMGSASPSVERLTKSPLARRRNPRCAWTISRLMPRRYPHYVRTGPRNAARF